MEYCRSNLLSNYILTSIHPTIHPTVSLFNQQSICHSVGPLIHSSNRPSKCSFNHPSYRLSVPLTICPSDHQSVHPTASLFVRLSIWPSIWPSINCQSILADSQSVRLTTHPTVQLTDGLFIWPTVRRSMWSSGHPTWPSVRSSKLHSNHPSSALTDTACWDSRFGDITPFRIKRKCSLFGSSWVHNIVLCKCALWLCMIRKQGRVNLIRP